LLLPVLRCDPGPTEAVRLVLLAGLSLDLELVRVEDAILGLSEACADCSLRPSFSEGVLVLSVLLRAAKPVRSQEVLLLYLLLGQFLGAGLEALAATGALALWLRWPMRYALALVSLRLNLRGSGSVLEALQVGVVIIQDLSVTLLRCGLLAGGPSADPC
jgi:hypothetical protein